MPALVEGSVRLLRRSLTGQLNGANVPYRRLLLSFFSMQVDMDSQTIHRPSKHQGDTEEEAASAAARVAVSVKMSVAAAATVPGRLRKILSSGMHEWG